ncbi:MAG: hypothetical protein AMXMBFR58_06770 [Phycisphaerae bacterium]|nr:hypothetical protein [Phycisphaerales bacterium]
MASGSASLIAWVEPTQVEFLRAIASAADMAIAGAGSPLRGQTTTVAAMLDCPAVDDLRQALVDPRGDVLLMLARPDLDFAQLAPTSMKIATVEPIPDSALAPVAGDWPGSSSGPKATPVHFIPLVRFGPVVKAASEILASFGDVAVVSHECLSQPGEGSLGARLFAAMDLVHMVIGEPDTIDAAFAPPPGAGPSATPTSSDTLAGLNGSITAHLRFTGQRSAVVVASNQAGRWNNTTTLMGAGGRLRLFDDGFEWIDASGRKLDEMRPKTARRGSKSAGAADASPVARRGTRTARSAAHAAPAAKARPAPAAAPYPSSVAAIADSLRRLLDNTLFPEPPADITTALAMGQAALLSCRTGQPESPATIRRMLSAV